MKITEIETIPVRMPVGFYRDGEDKTGGKNRPQKFYTGDPLVRNPLRNTDGHKLLDYVIVKIHTDEGITGVGEAPTDGKEPLEAVKFIIDKMFVPNLIGLDPFNLERTIDTIRGRKSRGANRGSVSAIDLALYDLVGKSLNCNVSTLLGGLYRNKVLASIEVPRNTPEKMAEHSLEYYEQGIRGIKAKVGSDYENDAKCLRAIRDALGDDISLRADVNGAYTVQQAIRFCDLANKYDVGLELIEQPTPTWDLDGMARVVKAVDIPVEADESAYSLYQVFKILKHEAADLINPKCSKAGGILGVKKWASVTESAGKEIVVGTEYGLGLRVAAKVILGCALKNAQPIVEFTEIMLHDLLIKKPLVLKDGWIDVPTGPGIGWELDDEKIEKFIPAVFP
ncbi:MAG: mandelate racemase/muconate lactonizing enzyme family protein [Candidatus Bathyarchaeota archaeon]|jgi:L-alanine-DL-glutamate epimerase-like enolase superfamily enzyme|nr:mandelate racemase/muconate lactonizing enzyme family protein [Candidatus Bathyarchaeota archaeon]